MRSVHIGCSRYGRRGQWKPIRHKCSFVTGRAREHTRRLLKLSFGRWIAQGNDSSEGCLYLPAEIRMHDSKFLLEGSLTDRALVLCLVTSLCGLHRAMPRWLATRGLPVLVR